MTKLKGYTTLSQLLLSIKESLALSFPLPTWISAEIGEMKINDTSGHCYMELIEKGGKNGIPSARAKATIWHSTFIALSDYFFSATGQNLHTGIKVLLKVSVNHHELYGLSLQISDIDPTYTLGEQEQQRLMTIAQLKEDGVFELNKELTVPIVLQRVAVISSANAAGYGDFMKELYSSPYSVETTLFQATVQGKDAENSIITALNMIADISEDFDCVVIIRGGGSGSDLSCFNAYELCCNVAQFPIPVITGIGHDKDQSVADMVAAISLKTPTAVAQYITKTVSDYFEGLTRLEQNLEASATGLLSRHKEVMQKAVIDINRFAIQSVRIFDNKLNSVQGSLYYTAKQLIKEHNNSLVRFNELLTSGTISLLSFNSVKLDMAEKIVGNSDPKTILSRGYSIVRYNGSAVRKSSQLKTDQQVEITFGKGVRTAKITN